MKQGKLLLIAAALAVLANGAQAADRVIRIATEGTYAPWSFFTPDKKLQGYDIDAALAACAHAGLKCEMIEQDWEGMIPALQAGKFDAIASSMAVTPERLKVVNFTKPYAISTRTFVALKDSALAKALPASSEIIDLDAKGPAADEAIAKLKATLNGKTVGLQRSTAYGGFLDQFFKGAFYLREYKAPSDMVLDINAGRVDAGITATTFLSVLMAKPEGKNLEMAGSKFTGGVFGGGVGIAIRKDDAELLQKLNAGMEASIKDGTLSKLSVKWFNADIAPKS